MSTIELAWTITTYAEIIAAMIITSISFCCFVRPYLQSKKTAIYAGMVYFTVMLVLYVVPVRLDNFTAYAIGILAAFMVMYLGDRRNVEQKIFLAVTFFSIRWLNFAMADEIHVILTKRIAMGGISQKNQWLQFGIYVGLGILHLAVSFIFIITSIYLLNKFFTCKKTNITKKELFVLIMPSISAMTDYGIWRFYQNQYEQDTGKSLILNYGIYRYLNCWRYVISIIFILVMVIVFQKLKAGQMESAGEKLLQSQIIDMKKHISEVEKLYQDIRLMRHDMGNHIQTIEHLLDENEKKEAAEYASRLRKEWQDMTSDIKSGNPVTDVILLEKKKEAEEQNIKFLCDFHYPEGTNADAFDISVILNNALDNSLESVNGELPYIDISSYRKNNIFMIVISNSFQGKAEIDDDTGLPVSTKKGAGHGLGLENIRRVAQMYLGDIAFEQEEGKVILTVMLQLE